MKNRFLSTILAGVCATVGLAWAEPLGDNIDGWLPVDASRLTKSQVEAVAKAFRLLKELELGSHVEVMGASSHVDEFSRLFGGASGGHVVDYLKARIRYLGQDVDQANAQGLESATAHDNPEPAESEIYAANLAPSWLDYVYRKKVLHEVDAQPYAAPFRESEIPIQSPRTGFMVVGSAYLAPDTTDFDRVETLVHEARHSDCPALPSTKDLRAYSNDKIHEISDQGLACLNIHAICPPGHELAGEGGCDSHAWGSYMVGYVFSLEVFHRCLNCTEEQKQEAIKTSTLNFGRLSPKLRKMFVKGKLPAPVMESIR